MALVVSLENENLKLVETFSDDREIATFETALGVGGDPLEKVYELREKQAKEDDDFGNYVEDLLSQPFVRPEIQEHGVAWLKSKIRIEQYQKCELEAAQIIASYAFNRFQQAPEIKEFLLIGPVAKVKIRVFTIRKSAICLPSAA